MKYIKTREEFKKTNEEFIFKAVKDFFAKEFSKMFGSSKKIDDLIIKYKNDIIEELNKKGDILAQWRDYLKNVQNGGDKDDERLKEIKTAIKQAEKNYNKSLELLKKKYDIQIDNIIKDEKNDKVNNYIQLKKIDLQRELLQIETKFLTGDADSSEIKDKEYQNMIKSIIDKSKVLKDKAETEKNELKTTEEKALGFDIEEAKRDQKYIWSESPYLKKEFKKGDEIKYFSFTNKAETEAVVSEDSESDNERMKVETTKGKPFEIHKGKVISIKGEEKAEEKADDTEEADYEIL